VHLTSNGSKGAWSASVPLPKGRHEYAFIVNGKQWVPDPFAPASSDEFDATSSVITIGD
jgi:1,4-alpha-glucan branching enzyme